jgi:nitroreductase
MLSIDRDRLRTILGVPEDYRIDSVLALGYPAEEPAVEALGDSVRYWKDEAGRLHVPKRGTAAVVHFDTF